MVSRRKLLLLLITATLAVALSAAYLLVLRPSRRVSSARALLQGCRVLEKGEILKLEFGDNFVFEYNSTAIILRHASNPGAYVVIRGRGGALNYLQYSVEACVLETRNATRLAVVGLKGDAYNFSAIITVFRNSLIKVEERMRFYGRESVWDAGFIEAAEGARFEYLLISQAGVQHPVAAALVDGGGRYAFSMGYVELTGKGSVLEGGEYSFTATAGRFGLNVPVGSYKGPSRFLYYVYVWRDEKDPLSGVLRMLSLLADIVEREYPADNRGIVGRILASLLSPPDPGDVYMSGYDEAGSRRVLIKAYVGDQRSSIQESEFITQANVLLGLAYARSKGVFAQEAEALMRAILGNTSYFDVYWDGRWGLYSNNWRFAGRLDSWYQVTNPSMLVAAYELAPDVVWLNLRKLESHARWLIGLARRVNYDFPVFAWPDYRVERVGEEADAALGYAYFMVKMYNLTGDRTFLEETERAVERYISANYGKVWESHLTAMGVAACAHLYRLTGDPKYLGYLRQLVYLALRWMHFIRGDIVEEDVPFCLVSAMPLPHGNAYAAAFEYGLFKLFLEEAARALEGTAGDEVVKPLHRFYSACGAVVAKYSLPRFLGIERRSVPGGVIDARYWVPVEDLWPFTSRKPALPQELYGFGSHLITLIYFSNRM